MPLASNWLPLTLFQHTAARRRLAAVDAAKHAVRVFQHTAARRRLGLPLKSATLSATFQHTAARRRLGVQAMSLSVYAVVSTHSRPKAAGKLYRKKNTRCWVSTHSRPKAAGFGGVFHKRAFPVSTHSRPKAAGVCAYRNYGRVDSFNTQPPEGGWVATSATVVISGRFQHTAARRRLVSNRELQGVTGLVSTHSRPKAAGYERDRINGEFASFNTQPPEGGWMSKNRTSITERLFQHTAARRRLDLPRCGMCKTGCFNTQPPEGGWAKWKPQKTTDNRFNTQPPEGGWIFFCPA